MLNVDYKILAKLFARRLKIILPDLIHSDQRGFVADRNISHSILDLFAIIDNILDKDEDFLICAIDIRKVFDSIDWDFLHYALHLYEFPQEFVSWFDIFYNDRTAFVVNNNFRSDLISINKGNFQGCPLSPLFFVLAIEILANRIRNNKEIIGVEFDNFNKKINLVADDILLIFKNTYSGCTQVEEELMEFSVNSGLKINKDKCSISRINSRSKEVDPEIFLAFVREKSSLKYIGLKCSFSKADLWELNIPPIIDKIITELSTCSELSNSTPLGRVIALKSLFSSHLPYFLELVILPSHKALKKIQSTLDRFVWNGKKPKMKLCNAALPQKEGGMGMINVEDRYAAIKIDILHKAVDTRNLQFWQAHLFAHFTVPFDIIIRSNLSFSLLKNFICKPLGPFWSEILQFWCRFHFVNHASVLDDNAIQEVLTRPACYNGAFGADIHPQKRWSERLMDTFFYYRWFSVADIISVGFNDFPLRGYITRNLAQKIFISIPTQWRKSPITDDNVYTVAQKLVDQKLRQKDTYSMIVTKKQSFSVVVDKWNKDRCNVDWSKLTAKVTKLDNGNLKNFFIMFNARSLMLNNRVSHFLPISDRCTLCKLEAETFVHLFWECIKIQHIWRYVHSLVSPGHCTKDLSLLPTQVLEKVVFLFTFCKQFIYLCRFNNSAPVLRHFKNKLLFHLKALRATLTLKNQEKKFDKIWGDLYSRLTL